MPVKQEINKQFPDFVGDAIIYSFTFPLYSESSKEGHPEGSHMLSSYGTTPFQITDARS